MGLHWGSGSPEQVDPFGKLFENNESSNKSQAMMFLHAYLISHMKMRYILVHPRLDLVNLDLVKYSQASANMISYNMISHNMMFQFGSKKFL